MRDSNRRDWLWEEVAALKRGRPEPAVPPGEEETALAAHLLRDALAASADPERQALSRERLLNALRKEPLLPRVIVAPGGVRTPFAAFLEMLVPAAMILVMGLAGWYLPAWAVRAAGGDAPSAAAHRPAWESSYCLSSLRALARDRGLQEEFGNARGLLRPN